MKNSEKNIVLIGMPASGKTTIGKAYAEKINWKFIDTDDIIRDIAKMSIPEIIEKEGEDGFKKYEKLALLKVSDRKKTIIATGGSAIYQWEALPKLGEKSFIVYIEVPFEELEKRCKDPKARGVIMGDCKTFRELYDERKYHYRDMADWVLIWSDNRTVESYFNSIDAIRNVANKY